jgi:glycosyltransferase involved in cell wall biosynthesis
MKISVVIPAHNEEQRIGAALEALLMQDHPDFEVIVVNNASTDRTVEVASAYPVKVLHEERKGTMWACERGRQEATGEIIVRMDADCTPHPTWLSRGERYFLDPQVVGVTGPYDYVDSGPVFRAITLGIQQIIYPITHHITHRYLQQGGLMVGGNSFMRASALEAAGGFNTDIVFYGDDTDTAKRLSSVGRIVFARHHVIPSSARRFQNEGILRIAWQYCKGFFLHSFVK